VDATISLESACFRFCSHLSDGGQEPVRRPALATIHAEGESAGPAGQAGKLPAADERVQHAARATRDGAPSANRQIGNPVHVELVGKIEVGDCTSQARGKGVCQAASDKADVLVAIYRKSDA